MGSPGLFRAVVLATLLASLVSSWPSEGQSGQANKVAYVDASQGFSNNCLAIYDPAAKSSRRVTGALHFMILPAFSAANGEIGFTNYDAAMKAEVYLLSGPGAKPRRVIEKRILEDFSRDGKQMLLVTADPKSDLVLRTVGDGREEKIPAASGVVRAVFSPDGKRIACQKLGKGGAGVVYVYSTATKESRRLSGDSGGNAQLSSWSPDGKRLLCSVPGPGSTADEPVWVIAFMDPETGAVTQTAIRGSDAALSPDGRLMAYQANDRVLLAGADGSKPVDVGPGRQPVWVK